MKSRIVWKSHTIISNDFDYQFPENPALLPPPPPLPDYHLQLLTASFLVREWLSLYITVLPYFLEYPLPVKLRGNLIQQNRSVTIQALKIN